MLWGIASVAAILSVTSGFMHAAEGGFDPGNLESHHFYGIFTAVGATTAWLMRIKGGVAFAGVAKAVGFVTLIAMLVTVYFGSRITHGDRFIFAGTASAATIAATPSAADTQTRNAASLAVAVELSGHGFLAREVSQGASQLSVATIAPGRTLDEAALAALNAVAANIVELNLSRSAIAGAQWPSFAGFESLEHLRLDNMGLTDEQVQNIADLQSLRTLNLHGNPDVSNASIERFASFPSLERLYLWGTGVDDGGIQSLKALRPGLQIEIGTTAADTPTGQ
jgi:hypothetical protein